MFCRFDEESKADYEALRHSSDVFEVELGNSFPSDILPILKYIMYRKEQRGVEALTTFLNVFKKMYKKAASSFTPGEHIIVLDYFYFNSYKNKIQNSKTSVLAPTTHTFLNDAQRIQTNA